MKIISCKTADDVASRALSELRRIADAKAEPIRVLVPTGSTPRPLYALMIKEKDFWAKHIVPIQIDDFADESRIFFHELNTLLFQPLGLEKIALSIDSSWDDDQIMAHIEGVLTAGVDLALLGMGPNGHVGFHEPGYPLSFTGGRVELTAETKNRIPKAETSQAITFGVGAFRQAREILLIVTGHGKASLLSQLVEAHKTGKPLPNVPVAALMSHPRVTLISDLL